MIFHQPRRSIAVLRFERIDDARVLGIGDLHPAWHVERPAPEQVHLTMDRGAHAEEAPIAAELNDRLMEAYVERVEDVEFTLVGGLFHLPDHASQFRNLLLGDLRSQEPARECVERSADIVEFGGFTVADFPDEHAPIDDDVNETALFEAPACFPHRTTAHAELRCERILIEAIAGLEFTNLDHALKLAPDEGGQGFRSPDSETNSWI